MSNYTLSKLCSVIPQLSQNSPRHKCFSSFLKDFLKYAQVEHAFMLSSPSQQAPGDYSRHIAKKDSSQSKDGSSNLTALKKGFFLTVVNKKLKTFIIVSKSLFYLHQAKMLLNVTISNLGKFEWFQFGLIKSDFRKSSRPKVKFKKDFLNISISPTRFSRLFSKDSKQ